MTNVQAEMTNGCQVQWGMAHHKNLTVAELLKNPEYLDALGDDDLCPTELLTPHQRLNLHWHLTCALWKIRYGVDPTQQKLPRSEWPVKKYDLAK